MIGDESVKVLEDLHRLKTAGVITDAEFEQSKQRILFGAKPERRSASSLVRAPSAAPAAAGSAADLFAWAKLPLQRYADFTGRSSRKEFWLFVALSNAVSVALFMLMRVGTDTYGDVGSIGRAALGLLLVWWLACAIPLVAAEVRRMHDQDRSGWLVAVNLVPYVGWLVVLVLAALPGDAGDNRFGPPHEGP